jgi:hypothetical protein
MATVNLIGVLDWYLIATFLVSTVRRFRQYRAMLGVVFAVPQRWPKLFQLVREHRTILLTWPALAPIAVTFLIMLVHTIAYRAIWHTARVTPADIGQHWLAAVSVLVFGIAMLWLDFTAIFQVADFDRPALERDLDQAEFWLRSWVTPTLRFLTFGFLNPRQIVSDEVRKALTNAGRDLNVMMWRWSLQIAVRLLFGLALWATWWAEVPGR